MVDYRIDPYGPVCTWIKVIRLIEAEGAAIVCIGSMSESWFWPTHRRGVLLFFTVWFTLLCSIKLSPVSAGRFCWCCWFLASNWNTSLWKGWNIPLGLSWGKNTAQYFIKTYQMLRCCSGNSKKMISLMSPPPTIILGSLRSLFCFNFFVLVYSGSLPFKTSQRNCF